MVEIEAPVAVLPGETQVRREVEGIPSTLEEVYDLYARSLYRQAFALTGSAEDAEDAVQEVMAMLAGQGKPLSRIRNLRAFLFTAVRNAAYSALRRRRRAGDLETALAGELPTQPAGDLEGRAVESVLLREAFTVLPPEQREVVVLKVFEGMTFREIAGIVRAPANTVASRYRYAMERLRRVLEGGEDGR